MVPSAWDSTQVRLGDAGSGRGRARLDAPPSTPAARRLRAADYVNSQLIPSSNTVIAVLATFPLILRARRGGARETRPA